MESATAIPLTFVHFSTRKSVFLEWKKKQVKKIAIQVYLTMYIKKKLKIYLNAQNEQRMYNKLFEASERLR